MVKRLAGYLCGTTKFAKGDSQHAGETSGRNTMDWRDHITVDPDEISKSYPSVSREAVHAAISYAAALANDRVVSSGG